MTGFCACAIVGHLWIVPEANSVSTRADFSSGLQKLRSGCAVQPADVLAVLSAGSPGEQEALRQAAEDTLLHHCGADVQLRGLIEFSNVCACDCLYCGIRKGNRQLPRYTLTHEDIVGTALWCVKQGYGSIVLQAGERRDRRFIDGLVDVLRAIKSATRSERLPDGLGITLSVGEQSRADYARLREAGAHRYLLRMETFSPVLFARLHPPSQTFAARLECLHALRDTGFMVGTGVMIGIPGQTLADLGAEDPIYANVAADVARAVARGDYDRGVVVCGTGINAVGRRADGATVRFPALGSISGAEVRPDSGLPTRSASAAPTANPTLPNSEPIPSMKSPAAPMPMLRPAA